MEKFDFDTIIENVLKYNVVAIVGLEKNTGKTETLNYIVQNVKSHKKLALTSIGTDGEEKDIVFGTFKPSVYVDFNFLYTTTELFFKRRTVLSEILHVSKYQTPTGRVIIARSLEKGKIILSGPPVTSWMEESVEFLKNRADLVLIDGALSRFSQATPFIAEGIILATGAAYSLDKREIIKHTKYIYLLCQLPEIEQPHAKVLSNAITVHIFQNNEWRDLGIESALHLTKLREVSGTNEKIEKLYIPGALTDNILKFAHSRGIEELIVRDFTKIFVSYDLYIKYKPQLKVLKSSNIIGITVNPFSPTGYIIDSKQIIEELKKHIPLPIIDVRKEPQQTQ
ncbi:lysine 5,6-aminomutase reactivase subunit KamB [Fervidobacterium sp.]